MEENVAMLQRNAEQHPNWYWALYLMGESCEIGCGCPKDLEKAVYYFRKAAEGGHVKAQNKMGDYYRHGDKGLPDHFQMPFIGTHWRPIKDLDSLNIILVIFIFSWRIMMKHFDCCLLLQSRE